MRILITAAAVAALTLAGCAPVESRSEPAAPPGASSTDSPSKGGGGDDRTAKVGQWVKSDDGLRWTVVKLSASRVGQYAAGGHPGDPAVIVSVKIVNGGQHRLDLSLVQVTARVGTDGQGTEEVFDGEKYGVPSGTLAPGRTVSARYAFAADKRSDLEHVSIEVSPGLEYESGTFEGVV